MTVSELGMAWDAHHIENQSPGHECTSWRCAADIAARLAEPAPVRVTKPAPVRVIRVPADSSPDYVSGWRDGWDAYNALPEPTMPCPCGNPLYRHFSHEKSR